MRHLERARLEIPGDPAHVQLARLVAAGIAGRLLFDVDQIEDLRIGVDECCVAILGWVSSASVLELEYTWDDDSITLHGEASGAVGEGEPRITGITAPILAAVIDGHRLWRDGDRVGFELWKRRSGFLS
ncbi:MAG TPA: hypothetical protein VGQ20_06560 [Acidimicrobiales bacterium]|jgi:serine/threonine-protein kinase RsbW|nr:hypothetical protein [Acidimicrobiales bacterium]